MMDKKRKILFVSQSFYPNIGGVSSLIINLAQYIAENKFDVYCVHFGTKENKINRHFSNLGIHDIAIDMAKFDNDKISAYSNFKEYVYKSLHGLSTTNINANFTSREFQIFKDFNSAIAAKINEVVDEHNIELIHFHDYQVMLAYKDLKKDIPKIFSLHAPLDDNTPKDIRRFFVKNLNNFNKIILSSPVYKNVLVSSGIKKKKIEIIYPLINDKLLDKNKGNQHYILERISKGTKVILCVQRFDSKSGQSQLINSFNEVVNIIPNSILLLVGGDSFTDKISDVRKSYKKEVISLVNKMQLEDRVVFTGNIDYFQLPQFYNRADIVVMLSKMECFGMSVTEAMSLGKPLIVTNVGGLKLQVQNNYNGFVVPVGDIKKTTQGIVKLLSDQKLYSKYSRASRDMFSKNFSSEKTLCKYLNLYNNVIKDYG